MTVILLAAALLVLLVAGATVGPRMLGGPVPTFTARPRLGMAIWTVSAAVWTLTLLALGPLLTWIFNGPALPGRVGAVCQRCLAAANPFSAQSPMWTTDVPAFAMLLIPFSLVAWLTTSATVRHVRSRKDLRMHLRALAAVAEQRLLHGTQVWVIPSADCAVYSLPTRRARIVISQGALDVLSREELVAVLSHERAHLEQRHHALLWALHSLQGVLGWVPLIAAAAPAVATYAEMAADDDARRTSSTRALAGALLALHRPGRSAALGAPTLALHAAATGARWRARRLAASPAPPSRWGVALTGGYLAAMTAAIALIGTPYAALALTGTC
ncbi:MAG: M56 family metallopeptidase [Actinomycetales bacterium]|nr:M56 family metallopeptidase [Actinomycetales bacterium]